MAKTAAQRFDEMAQQAQMQTPTQQFDQVFKQIGQYTSGIGPEYNGISAPPVKIAAGQPGGFGGFMQKVVNIGQQAGGMAQQLGSAALGFVKNSAVDIYKSTAGTVETVARLPVEIIRSNIDTYRVDELNRKRREMSHDYAAGRISKKDYQNMQKELNKESEDINKSIQKTLDWTNKKTVAERNKEIADTAVNILSFGSLGLANVGGKQALKMGSKEALDALIGQSATKLESIMLKNPAMRSLVTRNLEAMAAREAKTVAGQSAWQFVQMNGKKLATDLLIKRPVFYQSNIGQAQSLYNNILEGDYKGALTDAAWLGSQTINGGPLGAAKNLAGYTKSAVSRLAKGNPSVLDELSRQIGTKDWKQFGKYIADSNDSSIKKAAQVLQDSNLYVTKGDVKKAVDNILLSYSHLDPATITPEMIIKDISRHREAYEVLETAKKTHILDNLGDTKDKLAVVKWDATTRTSVADAVRRSAPVGEMNKEAATKAIHEMGDKLGFTNNFSLSTQLEKIIATSDSANQAADAIQAIEAAVGTGKYLPKPLQRQLAKLGYVLAEPAGGVQNKFIETEDLTKLISSAIKGGDVIEKPNPVLAGLDKKLVEEAKKFKSVDEFIASKQSKIDEGKTFYHGTGNSNVKSLKDLQAGSKVGSSSRNRVYVTENPEIAKNFGDNVIEEKLYGKHLDVRDIGVGDFNNVQDRAVASEFADFKTTKLLTEREKRVFDNQFVRGVPNNTIIEDTPGIHKYLASKGYTTITVPRTISDVDGVKSETIIISDKAYQAVQSGKAVDESKLREAYDAARNPTVREVAGNIFDPSAAPTPVVSHIAGFLERFGISPEDSNGLASKKLAESVAVRLNGTMAGRELGFNVDGKKAIGGDIVLSRLQQYIENKPGVYGLNKISAGQSSLTDVRQMTVNEIRQALATKTKSGTSMISAQAAKEVRQAVIKGFTDLPLEARGLADKIVDTLYAVNPMQKYYSRTQSALRYTYNPFFRAQETAETKILSKVQASNLVWMKPRGYSGSNRQWLDEGAEILENAGVFKGQLPGEAAGDVTLGRITANLTKGQKRDLAGLAYDIANSRGVELQQLASESPEILDDALRAVVQYPKKGVLASPLARTMNLAFFPMRYNAKVTMLAAQALEKQPPAIQKAVLHSMFTMKDWMKSDEGIAWQSKNADAIALFKWITPVNSIEGTMKLLTGNVNSPADLGQLGGLPLGIISQMLDSQGVINLNTPYVDPKTGSVFPKNIPKSLKARAAVALTDLINSTFTYPGRTLGLPGKNQAIKDLVKNFIDTNGTDFESKIQTERLTPLQQKWVEVLKGDTSEEAIDALYQSPATNQFNGYTIPPLDLPFNPSFDSSSEYKAPKASKTLTKGKKQKVLAPAVKQPL